MHFVSGIHWGLKLGYDSEVVHARWPWHGSEHPEFDAAWTMRLLKLSSWRKPCIVSASFNDPTLPDRDCICKYLACSSYKQNHTDIELYLGDGRCWKYIWDNRSHLAQVCLVQKSFIHSFFKDMQAPNDTAHSDRDTHSRVWSFHTVIALRSRYLKSLN